MATLQILNPKGMIKDTNNTALPNTAVELLNTLTNATVFTASNATGGYKFSSLIVNNTYLVTAWYLFNTTYRPLSHYTYTSVKD